MSVNKVVFLWDNFGPYHHDRCEAVARTMGPAWKVCGVETASREFQYHWNSETAAGFSKQTLFPGAILEQVSTWSRLAAKLHACFSHLGGHFFFCHYQQLATLIVAIILRLLGQKVYMLGNSKFDDYPRHLSTEFYKYFFFLPYNAFIVSSRRSYEYLRFFGVTSRKIFLHYNSVSIARIRNLSEQIPAPSGVPFADRHFTIVARLSPEKNLMMGLDAYAAYCRDAASPRPLHICGSGPLERILKDKVAALGLDNLVHFRGWTQARETCEILGHSLALLLPSSQEQFGNVVIEAQAMGLPVILSETCGARDHMVRSGVNGFVVEPDNPTGMAYFMSLIDRDQALWTRLAQATHETVGLGDVQRFAETVQRLTGTTPMLPSYAASGADAAANEALCRAVTKHSTGASAMC